ESVVPRSFRIPARHDRAHPGLIEQIPAEPRGKEVLPVEPRVRKITCLDVHDADVVVRLPSNDLGADADGDLAACLFVSVKANAPREKRNQVSILREASHVEYAGALEEERAL